MTRAQWRGLVGWSRRNFMVPLPRFASLEALNLSLEQRCRERQGDVLRGHRESIAKRLERDLEAMTALPGAPFDACHQAAGQVSSQSLVRYHNNDYSVPVAYGYRQRRVPRARCRGAAAMNLPNLTGALLDRLTHHVHILEMNGQSFRLNHSRARKQDATT